MRVAAVGDLHVTRNSPGTLQPIFARVAERADVLVLCGDLCDLGQPEEARVLARELSGVNVPVVGVLGNHDHEAGRAEEIATILGDAGVMLLDGDTREVKGVVFAGVKGFGGGFGRHVLEPWGEPALKAFVQEAVDEAMKLEKALARVRGLPCVAVLHYAPVAATVEGEPLEIYPFLGNGRLEEPLNRYQATLAVHGHAHRGSLEGRTSAGVPVYNVALPLLRRCLGEWPIRVVEVAASTLPASVGPAAAQPETAPSNGA